MKNHFLKTLFLSSLAAAVVLPALVFSVTADSDEDCQTLEECQALLKEYESQITEYEGNIARSKAPVSWVFIEFTYLDRLQYFQQLEYLALLIIALDCTHTLAGGNAFVNVFFLTFYFSFPKVLS